MTLWHRKLYEYDKTLMINKIAPSVDSNYRFGQGREFEANCHYNKPALLSKIKLATNLLDKERSTDRLDEARSMISLREDESGRIDPSSMTDRDRIGVWCGPPEKEDGVSEEGVVTCGEEESTT